MLLKHQFQKLSLKLIDLGHRLTLNIYLLLGLLEKQNLTRLLRVAMREFVLLYQFLLLNLNLVLLQNKNDPPSHLL